MSFLTSCLLGCFLWMDLERLRRLGIDGLMMRAHCQASLVPFPSFSLVRILVPRASTWHHFHPTRRKAAEIIDDAGHPTGRTQFYAWRTRKNTLTGHPFVLPRTKLRDTNNEELWYGECGSLVKEEKEEECARIARLLFCEWRWVVRKIGSSLKGCHSPTCWQVILSLP